MCFIVHSLETLEQLLWLCAASEGTKVREHGNTEEKTLADVKRHLGHHNHLQTT